MKSIRGTLGESPKSNFFSFQDIIMSVTGILIVISLMLALQIDKVSANPQKTQVSGDVDPASASPSELTQLESEILNKKTQLEAMQSARRTTASETEIQQEIIKLEDQIARLTKQGSTAPGTLSANGNIKEIKSKAAEIMRLRHEIEISVATLEKLRPSLQDGTQKGILLENAVKEAEAAVALVRLENKKLKLIRELSDTSKEPIIVDVGGNRIVVMRFDKPEPMKMDTVAAFERYLKVCNKEEQYFVLYVRPSGASHFEKLREVVKKAGFEIGYDATQETTDLSLGKEEKQ